MEKELVTETPCWYYKIWTADFVKVTNKAWFYLEKQKLFQSMSNLQKCFYCCSLPWDRIVCLIQGPSSVKHDHWIVVQWQEVIFLSKSFRLVLRINQPLIHRILEASFIGDKMTMAQGQLYLLLLLISHTSKFVCQLMGICWITKHFNDCANKLWAVFVPVSWCC